jgi:hypothetical protein
LAQCANPADKRNQTTISNEQTQPMTAEEGKNSVNIYRFAEAYHAYRPFFFFY